MEFSCLLCLLFIVCLSQTDKECKPHKDREGVCSVHRLSQQLGIIPGRWWVHGKSLSLGDTVRAWLA